MNKDNLPSMCCGNCKKYFNGYCLECIEAGHLKIDSICPAWEKIKDNNHED